MALIVALIVAGTGGTGAQTLFLALHAALWLCSYYRSQTQLKRIGGSSVYSGVTRVKKLLWSQVQSYCKDMQHLAHEICDRHN